MTKDTERDFEDLNQGVGELPSFKGAISAIDQLEAIFRDVGTAFSSYYKTLVDGGVPEDTARHMLVELHGLFWSSQFVPDVHIHTDDVL